MSKKNTILKTSLTKYYKFKVTSLFLLNLCSPKQTSTGKASLHNLSPTFKTVMYGSLHCMIIQQGYYPLQEQITYSLEQEEYIPKEGYESMYIIVFMNTKAIPY